MIINTKIISIQSFVIFYVPVEKIRQIKKNSWSIVCCAQAQANTQKISWSENI